MFVTTLTLHTSRLSPSEASALNATRLATSQNAVKDAGRVHLLLLVYGIMDAGPPKILLFNNYEKSLALRGSQLLYLYILLIYHNAAVNYLLMFK